ncbi:MAG: methyltransferase domain-containing protein [Candidatus Daviesbacteria bacterium]|nr:methyltransferase domain-containing protein [Candidatus Daviesbacteria bacterium]
MLEKLKITSKAKDLMEKIIMVDNEPKRIRVSFYMDEPKPFQDPQQAMIDRYTAGYNEQDSDISKESRSSLIARAITFIRGLEPKDVVLSLGAGKQLLESAYLKPISEGAYRRARYRNPDYQKPEQPKCQIITVDFADLKAEQLTATRFPNVRHLRASGDVLPLGNNTVSAITSNMALEYMPESALAEAYRVLVPGGRLFANVWTGEEYLQEWSKFEIPLKLSKRMRENRLQNLSFWYQFVRSGVNSYFGSDITQARKIFESYSFFVERLEKSGGPEDVNWWEADLISLKGKGASI